MANPDLSDPGLWVALISTFRNSDEPAALVLLLIVLGMAYYAVRDMRAKLAMVVPQSLAISRMYTLLVAMADENCRRIAIPSLRDLMDSDFDFDPYRILSGGRFNAQSARSESTLAGSRRVDRGGAGLDQSVAGGAGGDFGGPLFRERPPE